MVFLQPPRPEVSDGGEDESGNEHGILEDDGKGQGDIQQQHVGAGGDEEDFGVLQRESSQGREDQLGHA